MNRWNIPPSLEQEIAGRDQTCVYCNAAFSDAGGELRSRPTWEHIINDLSIVTSKNIVRCCTSCNCSKGSKTLEVWLTSAYCRSRGISADTVAPVVRLALVASSESFHARRLVGVA